MRFVEADVFTAAIERYLDDEQYRQLQIALSYTKSEQGDLTPAQTRQLSRVVWEEFT